jgi:hypothetical protein
VPSDRVAARVSNRESLTPDAPIIELLGNAEGQIGEATAFVGHCRQISGPDRDFGWCLA